MNNIYDIGRDWEYENAPSWMKNKWAADAENNYITRKDAESLQRERVANPAPTKSVGEFK